MFGLDGRSALVTGAGGGIGAAVATAFARAGASVLVTDIDGGAADAVAKSINSDGGLAESHELDVRDAAQAAAAVERAAGLGEGRLHILVNNAGAIAPAMFPKLSEESFRRILEIHLVGSFVCSQAALDYLPDDGRHRRPDEVTRTRTCTTADHSQRRGASCRDTDDAEHS